MELHQRRFYFSEAATVSRLVDSEGKHICHILEDTFRRSGVKVPGRTCIPLGRYEVRITWSPKFKTEMPLLHNVPGFSGIRIHPGRVPEHTEGCLLPGLWERGDELKEGTSRREYQRLFDMVRECEKRQEPVFINVVID